MVEESQPSRLPPSSLPLGAPPLIDRAGEFRCPVCGTVSNAVGLVIQGPIVPVPVSVAAQEVSPSSPGPEDVRQRRNTVGNLLAELLVFTPDKTTVIEVRTRVERMVDMLEEIYQVPIEEPPTPESDSPAEESITT